MNGAGEMGADVDDRAGRRAILKICCGWKGEDELVLAKGKRCS